MHTIPIEGWRAKLLEMVKKKFTLYKYHYFSGSEKQYICMSNGSIGDADYFSAHWYEFIMTFLCEVIFFPPDEPVSRSARADMLDFCWKSNIYWYNKNAKQESYEYEAKHPVDQLYDIFKQKEEKKIMHEASNS